MQYSRDKNTRAWVWGWSEVGCSVPGGGRELDRSERSGLGRI